MASMPSEGTNAFILLVPSPRKHFSLVERGREEKACNSKTFGDPGSELNRVGGFDGGRIFILHEHREDSIFGSGRSRVVTN